MELKATVDYEARGKCLLRSNLYDLARRDLEVAVSRNTDDPEVYFDLGAALSALGRREDAIDALRGAVRLMPESEDAVYALCWELERLGRYEEALDILRRCPKSDRSRQIYQHRGRIYGRQGRWKESFADYTESVWLRDPGQDPSDRDPERKYKRIMEIRGRAETLDPENEDSFFALGSALYKAEWLSTAADVMSTGVLIRPEATAYMLLGYMREEELRMAEAINAYKEGIEKALSTTPRPVRSRLYELLVMALYDCGRRREVMQYGAEAVSLKVDSRKMRKYYKRIKNEPDLPDEDQVSAGWTAPYYAGYHLRFPD